MSLDEFYMTSDFTPHVGEVNSYVGILQIHSRSLKHIVIYQGNPWVIPRR